MTNNLIVLKSEDCVSNLLNFSKSSSEKICLASMSHSYQFLKSKLEERGVKNPNVFFIDCISKSLFSGVQDTADCSFVSVHKEMKDFLDELSAKLKMQSGAKIFIFDSLSDLKKYWPSIPDSFLNFAKSLFPALSAMGMDSYFIVYEEDEEGCSGQFRSAFDGAYSSFSKDKELEG